MLNPTRQRSLRFSLGDQSCTQSRRWQRPKREKKTELEDDVAKLTAKFDKAAATSGKLKDEAKEFQAELAELAKLPVMADQESHHCCHRPLPLRAASASSSSRRLACWGFRCASISISGKDRLHLEQWKQRGGDCNIRA